MGDPLTAAAQLFRRRERALEEAREDLAREIAAAVLDRQEPQVSIVKKTGYTREHIRRIVEKARDERAAEVATPSS